MYVSCVFFEQYLGTSVIDSKLSATQWTTGDTASSVSLMVRLAKKKNNFFNCCRASFFLSIFLIFQVFLIKYLVCLCDFIYKQIT